MRRYGVAFAPRVRGYFESISRAGGAAGILQERPKTLKENEIMKSRKVIFTTVLSALVCFGLCQQVQSATDTPDPGSVSLSNTADGQLALAGLTTGIYNSAFGFYSLLSNSDASFNTGVGAGTLLSSDGTENTAVGAGALLSNTTGASNTAVGTFAMFSNSSGPFNTAVGWEALMNVTANANAAVGDLALQNVTTGFFNTAIGAAAGISSTTGHNNVYIGQGSFGVAGESNTTYLNTGLPTGAGISACFIGGIVSNQIVIGPGTPVVTIDTNTGQLGWGGDFSSKIAEQQKKIEEQQASITQLKSEMQTMVAQLKDQAAQIQRVSAQLEVRKTAPQVVANKP
jgi:hypothetical protein